MAFIIRLEKLRFFGRIGVFDFERAEGNDFEVNVEIMVDSESFKPEDLSSTISYADVYEVVEALMQREWQLLESVAKAMHDAITCRWPNTTSVKVKITKLHPPIPGIQGSCSVEYLN